MRLVYDIETDGLDATTIWVLIAHDLNTGTTYKFSDHDNLHGSIKDGVRLLENADVLIGHNIIGFDNRVVDKLYGTDLNSKKCYDTFIMSQVLRYKRRHRHGLAGWGEALGNAKIEYDDWSNYNKEMLKYCIQDVMVNVDVFNQLMKEFNHVKQKNPKISEGLKVEHACAVFNARVRDHGWNFDVSSASSTLERMNSRMSEIEAVIEPWLGMQTIYIDKEPKFPKLKKNGDYNHHTVRYLSELLETDVKPEDTHLWPVDKPFQRTREEQIELGSMQLVKDKMYEAGWRADEFNKRPIKVNNQIVRWEETPKITETSMTTWDKKTGKNYGSLIGEYYTIRSRRSVIEGWMEKQIDGRLHGNMWTCGTPTFRCRHEVIVNLPAVSAEWGKEIRELLKSDDGKVVVGADSSGNQLRGLCHYVGNADFTNEVIYGDQHQRNADALGITRPAAKSYLYAYLFGAGDSKLGSIIAENTRNRDKTGQGKYGNPTLGRESREKFAKSIKGLQELRNKLSHEWNCNKNGAQDSHITGLDGRPIFVPSEHQVLNYLLQSAEGITCKAAVMWAMDKIKEEGIEAQPLLFYHDEQAWQCKPEDADRVGQILKDSFEYGPKLFNVDCMDGGDYVIGQSYADVH